MAFMILAWRGRREKEGGGRIREKEERKRMGRKDEGREGEQKEYRSWRRRKGISN